MKPLRIFISSVQKEFAEERAALRDYLRGDALLRRFFEVFLFEDLPASDRRSDAVYLEEVAACDLYVGLFGHDYGYEDAAGVSPTEHEFNRATELGKLRLIYVKGAEDKAKHPKMQALIRRAAPQLIRRRFSTSDELRSALYASLIEHLERTGAIQSLPFDEQPCLDATLDDLDADAVRRFIREAHHKRGFSLSEHTPVGDMLATSTCFGMDGQPVRPSSCSARIPSGSSPVQKSAACISTAW